MIVKKIYNKSQKTYGPDLSGIGENRKVKGFVLNADGETYTVDTEWTGPCPFEITQLQGKLQLEKLGLYEAVEDFVAAAGLPIRIYWETATHWKRDSSVLNSLAGRIGMNQNDLDAFFTEAAKIK